MYCKTYCICTYYAEINSDFTDICWKIGFYSFFTCNFSFILY